MQATGGVSTMRRHALGLAFAVFLSACGSPSSGSAVLKFHGSVGGTTLGAAASTQVFTLAVDPSAPTIFKMKLIAAYLSEDIDPATQDNVGHTPMIYLNPDCQGDIEHCDISAGNAPDGKPITHIVSARPTARSRSTGGVRGFGEGEEDQAAAVATRAAAQFGGSSSLRRRWGQPAASFWKTSVRYASGSMPASVQVPITV